MRWIVRLGVMAVVLLALIAVIGEVVLRPVAEDRIAAEVARRYDMTERPDVHLSGRPFALRALQGRLDGATMTVSNYQADGLRVASALIAADDVRFSPGSVLAGTGDATAQRVEAQITVTETDLAQYLANRGIRVGLRLAPGRARAEGTVDVAGFRATGTASGSLSVTDGVLRFVPERVDVTGTPIPPQLTDAVNGAFAFSFAVPEVAGVRVTGVEVISGAATFTADVTDYALAG